MVSAISAQTTSTRRGGDHVAGLGEIAVNHANLLVASRLTTAIPVAVLEKKVETPVLEPLYLVEPLLSPSRSLVG